MAHPNEGLLQAFIDGEVAGDERARVAAHLEQCAQCRAELNELRVAAAAFSAALARSDLAPDLERARAAVAARSVRTARPRMPEVLRLIPREPARVAVVRRAFLRAAVLVLLAAGAVSASVPGSPVRRFFVNLWHQTTRLFAPRTTASRALPPRVRFEPQPAPAPAPPAGVSVLPRDGVVHILLHEPAPGLRVRVRVVPGARAASVEASGPAASAVFRTGPGRIEVNGAGAGDLRITIPRVADRALVEVDGKTLFSKDHDLVRHAAAADSGAAGTLFQLRP